MVKHEKNPQKNEQCNKHLNNGKEIPGYYKEMEYEQHYSDLLNPQNLNIFLNLTVKSTIIMGSFIQLVDDSIKLFNIEKTHS